MMAANQLRYSNPGQSCFILAKSQAFYRNLTRQPLYAEEKHPYAIDRFQREALRVYGVMDGQLAREEFLAGPDYTIADMACFPWVRTWRAQDIPLADFPNVKRWYDTLKQREGLRRGVSLGSELQRRGEMDAETRKNLFLGGGSKS